MPQTKDTLRYSINPAQKTKMPKDYSIKTKNERTVSKVLFFWSRLKRKLLRNIFLMRFLILIVFVSFVYFSTVFVKDVIFRYQIPFYISLVSDFLTVPPHKISTTDGRTNILLLGVGGEGHDAPELTDTIILVSVNHIDSSIKLISIPRDIWITDPKGKINNIYKYGNEKEFGTGPYLAKATISDIVGVNIHYYAIIDFSGFKKVIDSIGGIDVEVENSFTDNHFPIAGKENDSCNGDITYACRYETINFEKGLTHMDGTLALKYARSRYAQGDEGTDIARSKRQQLVINAVIKKTLSQEILFSKSKLVQIKDTLLSVIKTDIPLPALAVISRRVYDSKGIRNSYVIPDTLLYVPEYSPIYDNLYVFLPLNGDWKKIHEWVDSILQSNH